MIGYTVKIWLVSCLVVACNSGRVSFESKETTKETTIEGADNNAGEITQQVKPIITGRPLDILLVIDSSRSMEVVHDTLSKKLRPLLEKVKDSDWRIVITTATFTDCLRAVIDKDDKNHEQIFADTINGLMFKNLQKLEQYFSNWEDTVRMATKALPTVAGSKLQYSMPLRTTDTFAAPQLLTESNRIVLLRDRPTWCTAEVSSNNTGKDTPRAHWLRDESMLAILLITDEDAFSGDSSPHFNNGSEVIPPYFDAPLPPPPTDVEDPNHHTHPNCGCIAKESSAKESSAKEKSCECITDFWTRIAALRQPHVTAKIYGLLNEKYSKHYLRWRGKSEGDGKSEEELFDRHSWIKKEGDTGNETTADFESILNSISTDVAQQMHKTYPLDRFPDGDTLKVIFVYDDDSTKEQPASSYRIEGRNLIFNESPPLEVKAIKVTFSFKQ